MMRTPFTAILLLSLLATAVAAQTEISWAKLSPEAGGFTAMMPGKPEEQSISTAKVKMNAYLVTLDRGIYLVSYSDYDASIKLDPQEELEADRDNFNKELGATLLTSRNITLEGRQGIEFTSETKATNIRSKFFIRGNRVFQIAVMIWKDQDQTKTVETFFESFAFATKE